MLLIESKDGRSKMQCSSIYSYGFARKPPAGAGARSFVPCLEWLTNPAVGFLLFDTQRMQWRILCHTPVPDEEISWVAIYLNAIDFFGWFSKDAVRGFRVWTSLIDNMTNANLVRHISCHTFSLDGKARWVVIWFSFLFEMISLVCPRRRYGILAVVVRTFILLDTRRMQRRIQCHTFAMDRKTSFILNFWSLIFHLVVACVQTCLVWIFG